MKSRVRSPQLTACLFMAIVCLLASSIMFSLFIVPLFSRYNILRNGTEVTASVVKINQTTTVNKKAFFSIQFAFKQDGETIVASTNNAYSLQNLFDMGLAALDEDTSKYFFVEGQTIQIMHIGKDAVAKNYVNDASFVIICIVLSFTTVLGMVFLILFILCTVGKFGHKNIIEKGISTTGTYISHFSNLMVNGTSYYLIKLMFINSKGAPIEAKTPMIYILSEVEAFISLKKFPIKYLGKKIMITIAEDELASTIKNNATKQYDI